MPNNIAVDDDPSWNTRSVCEFEDCSSPTLKRRIRKGQFPPPDFRHGPYAYWKASTVRAARDRRIAECATATNTAQRQAQFDAAARARTERDRKREQQLPPLRTPPKQNAPR